ncbi:hypothetical protein HJC23_008526 [Cyclotella cryptica]|uniref:Uncharacterized protein n=1 Tax=Cyclotella cryptica TaxID=29204 RepID=A0ABD3QYS7_9STRA|eukprot:CCRYP_001286-RA/>CCRYP_001286-RA protein AED:0.24 eAED:0.23 QI:1790/1/0.88/1/0.5/0.44/9/895/505
MKMRAKVIGYIPLDRGSPTKTRLSHLLDITRAKNDSERLKRLNAAAQAFNHHDKAKHDHDVKAGAISILCNLLRSCAPFFIVKSKEVNGLCKILLQLYRCNEDRAKVSFCLDGSTLIIYLLEVIEINYRLGKKGNTKCMTMAQNLVDKLISLACVPLVLIKRHEELMSSLVSNINGATGRIVMFQSMKCVAMMSEHTQNKQVLLTFPGLMKSIEVGSRHMYEAVREESARIMCNLAWDARNKAQLAHRSKLEWAEMVFLTLVEPNASVAAKQYAMKTLSYMASEVNHKVMIINYDNGRIVKELIRLISDMSSFDKEVTITATDLVGRLICRATASQLVRNNPGFLVILASLGCGRNDVAVSAARVLKKLSTFIRHSDVGCHSDLLQALVTMSYGSLTEVLKWTVKAFAEQAASPRDRLSMIAHRGLLPALTLLAEDENDSVRGYALLVLNALAADVALAKGVNVDLVLERLVSKNARRTRIQPRCYSPTSIIQFDFDFETVDCSS